MNTADCPDACGGHLVLNVENDKVPALVHLDRQTILVGRNAKAVDLVLDSKQNPQLVSRAHAVLQQQQKPAEGSDDASLVKWTVRDKNSLNGVYVNDVKVSEAVLEDGDTVVFGVVGGDKLKLGTSKRTADADVRYIFRARARPGASVGVGEKRRRSDAEAAEAEAKAAAERRAELEKVLAEREKAFEEQKKLLEEQLQQRDQVMRQREDQAAREWEARVKELQVKVDEQSGLMQELNEKLENEKQAKDKAVSGAMSVADLSADVMCSVCSELMVEPATLTCSHTFCRPCVMSWFQTQRTSGHTCPTCRSIVAAEPVPSIVIKQMIDKVLPHIDEDDRASYLERTKQIEDARKQEAEQLQRLRRDIEQARRSGLSFLKVTARWTAPMRESFVRGLAGYKGAARVLYFTLIGCSVEWVEKSPSNLLKQACRNLALSDTGSLDILRQRLLAHIRQDPRLQP